MKNLPESTLSTCGNLKINHHKVGFPFSHTKIRQKARTANTIRAILCYI